MGGGRWGWQAVRDVCVDGSWEIEDGRRAIRIADCGFRIAEWKPPVQFQKRNWQAVRLPYNAEADDTDGPGARRGLSPRAIGSIAPTWLGGGPGAATHEAASGEREESEC
jgi:hypothetical protein